MMPENYTYITSVLTPVISEGVLRRYLRMHGHGAAVVRPTSGPGYRGFDIYALWEDGPSVVCLKRDLESMAELRYHMPTVGEVGYW